MTGSLIIVAGKDPLSNDAGHSSYVRAHARAAVAAGYQPVLLCVGTSRAVTETEYGTVVRLASRAQPVRALMIPMHAPLLTRGFAALSRRLPEPVVGHGFSYWSSGAVYGCLRVRAAGREAASVMSVYATHSDEARSQLLGIHDEPLAARVSYLAQAGWSRLAVSRFESAALRRADAVYANYDSVRRLVRDRFGSEIELGDLPYAPESAFEAIPENEALPAPLGPLEPAGAPLLVAASSHNGRKGVRTLIEALALARDSGTPIRGCLLGAGRLLEPHRALIRELGLARSVVATGWLPDQKPFLRAADIFALPSLAEQSGSMALLEAMQYGLPVVASAVDGIVEDVTDGVDGLLVAPGDSAGLAQALARLGADPALRARLGAAAHAAFERRFSGPVLAEALDAVYRSHGLAPLE